jgi:hypothetical protein
LDFTGTSSVHVNTVGGAEYTARRTAKEPNTVTKTTKTKKNAPAKATRKDDGRIQIVGRLPKDLSDAVRATVKRLDITLNAFMVEAFTATVIAARRRSARRRSRRRPPRRNNPRAHPQAGVPASACIVSRLTRAPPRPPSPRAGR